jgi:flagellar basal body-associated protein FliL
MSAKMNSNPHPSGLKPVDDPKPELTTLTKIIVVAVILILLLAVVAILLLLSTSARLHEASSHPDAIPDGNSLRR